MNCKQVLRDVMARAGVTGAGLGRKLGLARSTINRTLMTDGMTIDTFLKYVNALGGTVVVEWTDPGDARKRFRWEVDNAVHIEREV